VAVPPDGYPLIEEFGAMVQGFQPAPLNASSYCDRRRLHCRSMAF
jgi:hypothetical protein